MILTPAHQVKSLILRPTVGRGSLSFGEGTWELKVTLTPFFQGEKGDKGERGDSALFSHTHFQNIPASVWAIEHDLGFRPNVYVLDTAGDECEGDVDHTSSSSLTIKFSAAFAGTARLS